jgi:hypothetical protein
MGRIEIYLLIVIGAFSFWRLFAARIGAQIAGKKMAEYAKEAARARQEADLKEIEALTREIENAKIAYDRAKRDVKSSDTSTEL